MSENEMPAAAVKRTALITGGCNGIGRAVALSLLAEGRRVVILDKASSSNREAVGGAQVFDADVTKASSVRSVMESVASEVGHPIDILVNCVGASLHGRKVDQITDEDWDATFDLNVRSAFLCTRAVVPQMKMRKWGRIINISAVAGRTYTLFGGADFTAAKAAVIGFTRQCALELAPFNITVNVVAPGLTLSERVAAGWEATPAEARARILDRIPAGRPSSLAEQAAPICFLCREDAAYVSGAVLDVNGAMFVA
jgi:NAD(P)-dependent dehydrogenase (short-subunit alcohol dehydrogenase family)